MKLLNAWPVPRRRHGRLVQNPTGFIGKYCWGGPQQPEPSKYGTEQKLSRNEIQLVQKLIDAALSDWDREDG